MTILAIFCLNIILRVDRKYSLTKAYTHTHTHTHTHIYIYGIYHSKFFSRHTRVNIIKHWKLRLHKLHILTWSHHFLFLVFQYDMPVIDLLSFSYKLTLFACSVKMNLTLLNILLLTPDTRSVSGGKKTLEKKGLTSCPCCAHLARSSECARLALTLGSYSA